MIRRPSELAACRLPSDQKYLDAEFALANIPMLILYRGKPGGAIRCAEFDKQHGQPT